MKILFDHQAFSNQDYGGVSRYFYELYRGINNLPGFQVELPILFSNNIYLKESHSTVRPFFKGIHVPKKVPIIKFINKSNTEISFKNFQFSLYHPTHYDTYLLDKIGKKPIVITVHDMIHEKLGNKYSISKDTNTINFKKKSVERADKIIAVSQSTKNDLIEILDIPSDRVEVIYHGSSIPIVTIDNNSTRVHAKPYILYLGTRRHYKNFDIFIEAIAPILKEFDIDLICGGGGNLSSNELELIKKFGIEHYVYQKKIDDDHLQLLYRQAIGFVFPSLYEGFGIPVLEAFSCGCPCVISNTSSLPEVGGNAALYFDPTSVESMQYSIRQLLNSSALREELTTLGFERLKLFSWNTTVDQTVTLYKSLL
ncbi:glycosyltransferase family 4 protein [Spirosoma sordidisoli]|uniref:Glycosyltransferase family 1 protein n=1 Tax=Spirosoma sordidisoli TaxID=2502893 RepID=A0A4Q2UQ03_9BACT|nr:glycosyltransferase family 1 protein [Spirosoma sordidisoli]RYC71476.1 glycosyltransferase family 1 protein [Spirosoma sordidisoli]